MRKLAKKVKELKPLNDSLIGLMSSRVYSVASQTNPAFALYLCILLGYPDVTYVNGLVFGFKIIGMIEAPPCYRAAFPEQDVKTANELLEDAEEC